MNRKNKIPEGWLDYNALGSCIKGTKIIPFKTPLRESLIQSNRLPMVQWFTPSILLEREPRVKAVIDLTKATVNRYYDGREFKEKGIDHINIKFEGRGSIPQAKKIDQFIKTIDFYVDKFKNEDSLVGVHCTHGINRTGYLICQWLIHRMKLEPIEAINQFNKARGHDIAREPLIDDLIKGKYTAPAVLPSNSRWKPWHYEKTNTNNHHINSKDDDVTLQNNWGNRSVDGQESFVVQSKNRHTYFSGNNRWDFPTKNVEDYSNRQEKSNRLYRHKPFRNDNSLDAPYPNIILGEVDSTADRRNTRDDRRHEHLSSISYSTASFNSISDRNSVKRFQDKFEDQSHPYRWISSESSSLSIENMRFQNPNQRQRENWNQHQRDVLNHSFSGGNDNFSIGSMGGRSNKYKYKNTSEESRMNFHRENLQNSISNKKKESTSFNSEKMGNRNPNNYRKQDSNYDAQSSTNHPFKEPIGRNSSFNYNKSRGYSSDYPRQLPNSKGNFPKIRSDFEKNSNVPSKNRTDDFSPEFKTGKFDVGQSGARKKNTKSGHFANCQY